jgi:TetR/AcrR family transcriptional regulator of autoinduction and epiphytic fitness
MDGRLVRSRRSREAVVSAMLELLREGHIRPGADVIAERAGVSLRTLFRHTRDLDELFAAAVDAQADQVRELHRLDIPAGAVALRVKAVVSHRSRLYEAIAPVRRAAIRTAPFHKTVAMGIEQSHRELRQQLEPAFSTEIRAAGRDRLSLVAALDAATCWRAWEALRHDQGLTVAEAEAAVRLTLLALLTKKGTS